VKIIFHSFNILFGNAATCALWHAQRGFRTIGYHYVILNGWLSAELYNVFFDGWLETGRPLDDDSEMDIWERGAHVKGWNKDSIGVGLVGLPGQFTRPQLNTARNLTGMLREQFFEAPVYQHGDFDPKKEWCAGLTQEQMKFIRGEDRND